MLRFLAAGVWVRLGISEWTDVNSIRSRTLLATLFPKTQRTVCAFFSCEVDHSCIRGRYRGPKTNNKHSVVVQFEVLGSSQEPND